MAGDPSGRAGRWKSSLMEYAFAAAFGFLAASELAGLVSVGVLHPVLLRGGTPPSIITGFAPLYGLEWGYTAVGGAALMLAVLLASFRGGVARSPVTASLTLSSAAFVAIGLLPFPPLALVSAAVAGVLLLFALASASMTTAGDAPSRVLVPPLFALLLVLAATEAASAARWVSNGFDGLPLFAGWAWLPSYADLQLAQGVFPILPQLVLLFLAAWVLRLLARYYWNLPEGDFGLTNPSFRSVPSPRTERILLASALVTSVFVGAYAYLPAINPNSILVGTDVAFNGYYASALNSMLALPPPQAVYSVLGSDRFLTLLLQYAVAVASGSSAFAIRAMPAIVGSLFALGTYFFARAGTGDGVLSGTAAVFAAASATAASSVSGGLYAGWLAAGLSMVYGAFLLRSVEKPSSSRIALASAMSVAILFTHTWTWFLVMAVTAAYGGLTALRSSGRRTELGATGAVLLVSLAAYLARLLLPSTQVVGDVASTAGRFDLASILQVYPTLLSNFQYFLGGSLADPLLFALAALGLFALGGYASRFGRLLLSWVLVADAGVLFTQFSFDYIQARVLLLVPLSVFAAVGFLSLTRVGEVAATAYGGDRLRRSVRLLMYAAVYSAFLGYALRTVGVLYTGA